MKWIGAKPGGTRLFDGTYDGKWVCVETHVKLNSAGKADGVHEFWIGDSLEASRPGLDFLGTYKDYGLNGILFENYWNSGSPQNQKRWFDNIVVSTQRVGCAERLPGNTGLAPMQAGAATFADGRAVRSRSAAFLPVFLIGDRPQTR
jgi:hypothetical protein